jgi:hypothetical protein
MWEAFKSSLFTPPINTILHRILSLLPLLPILQAFSFIKPFAVSSFLNFLLSFSEMAKKKSVSDVPSTSGARTKKSDGSIDLSPLESRAETNIFERHEDVLCLNYDIPPTVRMFYQNPETRAFDGGDITLIERMFMAGLRLPFPEIIRDFVLFLMVTPSQILQNAWRYLFASYILWRLVLKMEMKILQFFNIYRPRQTLEGMIELAVQHPLSSSNSRAG